ncbi:hypothetical protein BU26DRAFT_405911, partial [Trematosphaeria pertusa]
RSEFFRAASKPEWTGPSPKLVQLTDVDPAVFKAYMQWLYTKKVAQIDGLHLARCYVLGEKLMDVAFQNAVMDAILDRAMREDLYPSSGFTRIIFQGTTKSSPARKVLVDFW